MKYICPPDKRPIYRYTDVDSNGEYWTADSTEWLPSITTPIRTCINAGWLPLTRKEARKLFPAAFASKKRVVYTYIIIEGMDYNSLFRYTTLNENALGEQWYNNQWVKENEHPTAYFLHAYSKNRFFTKASEDTARAQFPDAFK